VKYKIQILDWRWNGSDPKIVNILLIIIAVISQEVVYANHNYAELAL